MKQPTRYEDSDFEADLQVPNRLLELFHHKCGYLNNVPYMSMEDQVRKELLRQQRDLIHQKLVTSKTNTIDAHGSWYLSYSREGGEEENGSSQRRF